MPETEPTAAAAASSYDAVPYSIGAFPQTRPDRLATLATLFGMAPAAPSRCRVLELGCAAGGNIIPMALADPGSEFVGIDLSARQIADAQATARQLNLSNIDLRALSITDVGDDFGTFDYILCHGVYSWVPPEVQDKILAVCATHLAPNGVAYVSYNCYPGWHARGAIREMLWYHTARFEDPVVRVRAARGLLAFLARFAPDDDSGYGKLIRQELGLLLVTPDTYLLHEHLEEFNEPLYFHQFARRAAAKGLQYLAEAQIGSMVAGRLGAEAEQILRQISPDLLHMEQYMDFLRNRMFRQTLLCHAGTKLEYGLSGETVTRFYIGAVAKPLAPADEAPTAEPAPAGEESFGAPGKPTLKTHDPLMKGAMHCLAESDPLPLRFDELLGRARAKAGRDAVPDADEGPRLATRLLNCYLSGLVDFSLSPPSFVGDASDRPIACPYARLRAREDGKVVNRRLETVPLTAPSKLVLRHLDGTRDRAALAKIVASYLREDPSPEDAAPAANNAAGAHPKDPPEVRAAAYVEALLQVFARSALLIA